MTECTIIIDGTAVPVDKYEFSTPRHMYQPLQPAGRGNKTFLGAGGFGISFCGPADVLRPYLDGEFHDVVIRPELAAAELAARVRLLKNDEENGTWYGHGCVTSENYQVIAWKELIPNG